MATVEQRLKKIRTYALGEIFSDKEKIISYFDKYLPEIHASLVHNSTESYYKSFEEKIQDLDDEASIGALKDITKKKIAAFKASLLKRFNLSARLIFFQILFIPVAIIIIIPLIFVKQGGGGLIVFVVAAMILALFAFAQKAFKRIVYKKLVFDDLKPFCEGYFSQAE